MAKIDNSIIEDWNDYGNTTDPNLVRIFNNLYSENAFINLKVKEEGKTVDSKKEIIKVSEIEEFVKSGKAIFT